MTGVWQCSVPSSDVPDVLGTEVGVCDAEHSSAVLFSGCYDDIHLSTSGGVRREGILGYHYPTGVLCVPTDSSR